MKFKKLQENAEYHLLRDELHLAKQHYVQMLGLKHLGKNQRKTANDNIDDINEKLRNEKI